MYKLLVRRTSRERWTAWTCTNDIDIVTANIKVIESYGWQWKFGGNDEYDE